MSDTKPPVHRNVLVVGGTSGLGQAVAREFAPIAEAVHLTYHGRRDDAEKTAAMVAENGGNPVVHQLSLPDPDPKGAAVRRLLREATPCDVVVNCAVANQAALATVSNAEHFKAVIDANVFGVYQVNAVAAQAMAATGGGTVINVSSILTRHYIVGAMPYITSKAAIEAQTRGFAREWGRLGLRFNTVSPGPIRDTRLLSTVPREAIEEIMGGPDYEDRLLAPRQVAAVIRQVAGADFAAMNGEVVTVDDGFSL
ncbi:SDR family oxidoreductase [Streptomyces sp. ISL-10]|uniref:SDR family NAD(P)-dependent oxidoreductase n=1 Tax=Streptomyces sp. ISL-10 TaxID=2819172 RepID=UPI001BE85EBC|nr:SDR family oxidoreductase [Streptomyces sp. ISL-10]MBT2364800.1 SDR family oxidoreductase [Streptomyces sp. ISL-10]